MSETFIDDQDLSRIKYNGTWAHGGIPHEHDGTVTSSTIVGDSFTVSFSGNSVIVYGTIDVTSEGVQTNYSVDGESPVTVTSQGGSGDTYRQQFWKSPILKLGEHHLEVKMIKVNSDPTPGEGTIWFDYFLATDPTIRQNTTPSKKVKIGAIVGGTIAGVFALAFIIIFWLFHRRRKRRQSAHAQPIFSTKDDGEITPYTSNPVIEVLHLPTSHPTVDPFIHGPPFDTDDAPSTATTVSGPILPRKFANLGTTQQNTSTANYFHAGNSSTPNGSLSLPTSSTGTTGESGSQPSSQRRKQSSRTADVSSSSPNVPEPVQHVDSGVRAIVPEAITIPLDPVELPPIYSPV